MPSPCFIRLKDVHSSYYLRANSPASPTALEPDANHHVGAAIARKAGFAEIQALRGISLDIADGARVGLIGINGSGKSTLLKLCAGTLGAQKGTVNVQGSINPQFSISSGMRPQLTGRQNAILKCLYFGLKKADVDQHIHQIRAFSGLGEYFDLPIRVYSAGMRSRLSISILGLLKGDIVVMDEWLSAADASINDLASAAQTRLIESSRILLMASHSEGVLRKWTDSLVWLDRGRIVARGSHDEVLKEYKRWLEHAPQTR